MSSIIEEEKESLIMFTKKNLGNIIQALIVAMIIGLFSKFNAFDNKMIEMRKEISKLDGKSLLFLTRQETLMDEVKENGADITNIKQNAVTRAELKESVRGVEKGLNRLSDKVDKIR